MNVRRLAFELKMLEGTFGHRNINYPSDGRWVKISNYRLPQDRCRYNLRFTPILILIPENYDSVGISLCYIDRDLKIRKPTGLVSLPHTHDGKYKKMGYQWLCFEISSSFVGLLDFINTLKVYFTDPFLYQKL